MDYGYGQENLLDEALPEYARFLLVNKETVDATFKEVAVPYLSGEVTANLAECPECKLNQLRKTFLKFLPSSAKFRGTIYQCLNEDCLLNNYSGDDAFPVVGLEDTPQSLLESLPLKCDMEDIYSLMEEY